MSTGSTGDHGLLYPDQDATVFLASRYSNVFRGHVRTDVVVDDVVVVVVGVVGAVVVDDGGAIHLHRLMWLLGEVVVRVVAVAVVVMVVLEAVVVTAGKAASIGVAQEEVHPLSGEGEEKVVFVAVLES